MTRETLVLLGCLTSSSFVKGVTSMVPASGPPVRQRASTSAVLEFAWDAGAFRADHVMASLDLTRTTALTALESLIEIGLISELPASGSDLGNRLGRPARRFELRGEAGLVLGIDAGDRHFTAVAADLSGRIVARTRTQLRPFVDSVGLVRSDADPEERRVAAFEVIDAVLREANRTRGDVIGVGVGIPAPVNRRGQSPSNPSGFWEYMNADLHDALAEHFPAVRVENDAAFAAVAEGSLGEARGREHFVAMLSGRRLGSGVVLEGQLVRGAHGGVGELEALSYIAGIGGAWGFGDLAEKWVRAALEDGRVPIGHPWARLSVDALDAEAVLADARLSDPVSGPLLEELGAKLGVICSVLSRFYDPELVVVCGAMAGELGPVIEIAQRHLAKETELPPPGIVASGLGGEVVSLGAVAAARDAAQGIVLPLLTERHFGTRPRAR